MLSKAAHDVNMNWFACVSQCSTVNTCMLQCMMPWFSVIDHRQWADFGRTADLPTSQGFCMMLCAARVWTVLEHVSCEPWHRISIAQCLVQATLAKTCVFPHGFAWCNQGCNQGRMTCMKSLLWLQPFALQSWASELLLPFLNSLTKFGTARPHQSDLLIHAPAQMVIECFQSESASWPSTNSTSFFQAISKIIGS